MICIMHLLCTGSERLCSKTKKNPIMMVRWTIFIFMTRCRCNAICLYNSVSLHQSVSLQHSMSIQLVIFTGGTNGHKDDQLNAQVRV